MVDGVLLNVSRWMARWRCGGGGTVRPGLVGCIGVIMIVVRSIFWQGGCGRCGDLGIVFLWWLAVLFVISLPVSFGFGLGGLDVCVRECGVCVYVILRV